MSEEERKIAEIGDDRDKSSAIKSSLGRYSFTSHIQHPFIIIIITIIIIIIIIIIVTKMSKTILFMTSSLD